MPPPALRRAYANKNLEVLPISRCGNPLFDCDLQADYSKENCFSETLPFIIGVNPISSDWDPATGDPQRFCYQIMGVGECCPTDRDLDYFILDICDDITLDDIVDVIVTVDNQQQTVELGINVRIVQDPNTGSRGLLFNFPLCANGGVMGLCFSLANTYPVGHCNVSVFGGCTTLSGQFICGPFCAVDPCPCPCPDPSVEGCDVVAYQPATVCVPVSISPVVTTGEASLRCCGNPTISDTPCRLGATANPTISFTLTQRICIAVPISIGAEVTTGTPVVTPEDPTTDGCSCNG